MKPYRLRYDSFVNQTLRAVAREDGPPVRITQDMGFWRQVWAFLSGHYEITGE